MAARGESVTSPYGGASAALSNASCASASGLMQAKSGKKARAKADFESTQLRPSDEGWTDDDLFDAKMENQQKSAQIAKAFEREKAIEDDAEDPYYYNEAFDKNGVITGNNNTGEGDSPLRLK